MTSYFYCHNCHLSQTELLLVLFDKFPHHHSLYRARLADQLLWQLVNQLRQQCEYELV